jgi:hypothetical protein
LVDAFDDIGVTNFHTGVMFAASPATRYSIKKLAYKTPFLFHIPLQNL